MIQNLKFWLDRHRASSRMAFILSTAARLINSGMALLWTRWLLETMGAQLYGLFISFQALISLAALGDLGLGGSVTIEANRLLGARKLDDLRDFLAKARTVFLALALAVSAGMAVLAPWLARELGFADKLGKGALPLFFVGAFVIGMTMLGVFTNGLSISCGNLAWPILPNILVLQLAMALHLFTAKLGAPLWVQFLPYAGLATVATAIPWIFTKASHPEFAALRFVRVSWDAARRLLSQSFWIYLWSFGFVVYIATDRLVINRFFGPIQTSHYYLNYKPCELAIFTLATLTFVSVNKIIQWHCSPGTQDRQRAIDSTLRLQRMSIFLACIAGLAYLVFNDAFIYIWLGPGNNVSLGLQALFAANLAVTISGDAGTKIAGQINHRGTVFAGLMVAATALINLLLSLVAARAGLILGIAAATLLAQSFFGITTGIFTARQLSLSRVSWIMKSTFLPLVVIGTGFVVRRYVPLEASLNGMLLGSAMIALVLGIAFILGINRELLREEWQILRFMANR